MALATLDDVQTRLGRPLTADERVRLPSLLDDATALVVGFTGQDFTSPYPTAVVGVVAKAAARVISAAASAPAFAEQQQAGPFSVRFNTNAASGDVWLTSADKTALRPYRRSGGMTSVGLYSDRYSVDPTSGGVVRADSDWLL
ncbi:MAG TPA: hypothetical protein VFH80_28300 [Solirubrobacteraceae bacterium]|nr:hypothetical protein [Solirubrobacteraceae bacterium]